ncbi:MAG TPA: dockerin type I repeat-containing protein, partial [Planctomycetota bacterium]|nr:dockerin type I repeat-containing protein [Planctomycetota bacterium]
PFLVNEPVTLETFQSEGSHVLPLHRLKSTWGIETRSGWLTPESLAEGLFDRFSLVGTDGCSFFERHDILSMADYSFDGGQVTLRFELPDLLNPRRYELAVSGVPSSLPRSMPPIVTPHDFFNWGIVVHHAEDVLGYDPSEDRLKMIHEEFHQLAPEIVPSEGDILVERIVEDDGIRAEISFYWPPAPRDLTVGYTAPLAEWRETRITGLTAEPFVLTGSYSQSYAPLHHNVSENFLFVPTLEPDISPAVLAELRAKDVYAIWVYVDERTPFIETYGASELGVACDCIPTPRGDVNGDGARDLSDGIYLLQYLFASGPEPVVPIERTDLNGDSALDISDPVFLFRYLFLGGDAPPSDCLP